MNDLFVATKSKRDQLLEFILSRNFTPTHIILEWAVKNYHARSLRDAQEMSAEGSIRRLTPEEQRFYFPLSKEGVFVRKDFKS